MPFKDRFLGSAAQGRPRLRHCVARRSLVGGTWLVGSAVLIQVLLTGLGVYTYPGFFVWHASVNGSLVFFLPLLLLVLVG